MLIALATVFQMHSLQFYASLWPDYGSRVTAIGKMTAVRVGKLRNCGSIPDKDNRIFYFQRIQTGFDVHSLSYSIEAWDSFLGIKWPRRETGR
jgi:hypothetical protein